MNSDVNELARAVLKKPLEECSIDELQQIAEQYPYFGPIQLLLAKKISATAGQQDNSSPYEEQVQKASLYFQNRVWLHHLLSENGDRTSLAEGAIITQKETTGNEEPDKPEEFAVNENKESELIEEAAKEEMTEQTQTPVEMTAINIGSDEQGVAGETREEQLNPISDNTTMEETSSPMEMPALKIEPIPVTAGFVFEPYHTVDYFASQGIKFKEEEKPKDRFDMQLKSFTEWLKTLKQAPGTEIAINVDSGAEKKVEQMAEYSIAERHVITEAMAEVWKKQGNKAKAEEIYRKLSLFDPSKSSYFAAKIEDLKKTS